jgi:hypothetical protein
MRTSALVNLRSSRDAMWRTKLRIVARTLLPGLWPLLFSGCDQWIEQSLEGFRQDAVSAVDAQLDGKFKGRISLRTEANQWGEGLIVYSDDPNSESQFIWVFARGEREYQAYAFGKEEIAVTPRMPLLSSARQDVRRSVGLTNVSREQIREFLDTK